jgi:hypothetical protein
MGYKDKYFWGVLNMDGHTLTLKSATILVNAVMKNTSSLLGKDSSMVQSLSVDNPITLAGCVTLIDGNVTFNGDVTVADTLQNGGSLGWLTPKFMAKLTNNGVIRNNPRGNELWMDLYGDIVNNGKWAPAKTCFGSGKAQRISQAQNVEFNGLLQKKTADGSADTLPLIAASDLVINASRFDAQGYKSSYFWGVVDMDGHILTLKGPTLLVNAVMKNVKTLAFRDSSALQSASFDSAVNLAGHATLIDGNVTFNGEVTVADTLQNGGSLGWLTPKFKSKLINNGVIRNNPKGNELWVDLYGDVVNNGKWVLAKTCFASDKRQRIGQAENVEFGGLLQKKTSDGNADTFPLVATSDIVINAGRFDAQGYKSGYFWGWSIWPAMRSRSRARRCLSTPP